MTFRTGFGWLGKILICYLSLLPFTGIAQQDITVSGTVRDKEDRQPQVGATVSLTGQSTVSTDEKGSFVFKNNKAGKAILRISAIGYRDTTLQLALSSDKNVFEFNVFVSKDNRILTEVKVDGITEKQQRKTQAIRAVVVDATAAQEQPATLSELINRSPGIRVRQSGGLGNEVDLSINGFQSNSVQYFRDGIPLEYLGGGFGLNNVPVNLLDRVEIYKGVVPVSLGGDALGGAINMVSKKIVGTKVDASYEIASFGTHIASLSAMKTGSENRTFGGFEAFYNNSRNDYKVDVSVVDQNANLVPVRVPLFHNSYKQYFVEAYAGVRNRSWADELRFSLVRYDVDRASQHPALMTIPYGAVMVYNQGWVPGLRYTKSLMDQRLKIDQFASVSFINRARVDTVKGSYDWYGTFTPGNSIGESSRPALSDINFRNIMNRTNVIFDINNHNKLEYNFVYNYSNRTGEDKYGMRFNGTDIDILSKEAVYNKIISGLMWESKWMDGRLTNQVTAKHFYFRTKGINGFLSNSSNLEDYTSYSGHNWGASEAVKYQINDHSFVRSSLEWTNRLPRDFEIFGDNDTRAPNFELKPEKSLNINLAYRYGGESWSVEAAGFYRKTEGLILLVPVQAPFAQYQNLDNVRGYGFDIDAEYRLTKQLRISANASWQDNRMADVEEGLYKWIEGTRLRNTPYFFSNAGLYGQFNGWGSRGDTFRPYFNWNFIREFYLNNIPRDLEPGGFLGLSGTAGVPVTNIVPNQHLLSGGFTYHFIRNGLTVGAEVKNIGDARLFDYYKIQRAGRSYHLKLTYTLNLKQS